MTTDNPIDASPQMEDDVQQIAVETQIETATLLAEETVSPEPQNESVANQLPQESEIVEATSWEDSARSDLKHLNVAVAAGWQAEFTAEDMKYGRTTPTLIPHDSVQYTKGAKLARKVIDFGTKTEVWNVIDDRGLDYARKYQTFVEVLEQE